MTAIWPLLRGRVYAAKLSNLPDEKHFLVVSNNRRNRQLPQVLAVRLTTSPKPAIPSIIEIPAYEPLAGRVVCDDIVELYEDEVRRDLGALSPAAMRAVEYGLCAALDL